MSNTPHQHNDFNSNTITKFCPKQRVVLPGDGCSLLDFATQASECMKLSRSFFRHMGNVVSLSIHNCNNGAPPEMHIVKPAGFVIDSEEFIEWGTWSQKPDSDGKHVFESKSISERDVRRLLDSRMMNVLPQIKGILNIPMPFVTENGFQLTKLGYCENTGYWTQNSINFTEMPIAQAKEIIFDLFKEFRFLEMDVDRSIAVAYLITPALRFFLKDERAPIFLADGNRPGVGKDCLLRTAPLLYTGIASDQSPCSSDAEWKKVINSACFKAAEFLIITNLKNHLDSQALEGASTSSNLEGRILGESTLKTISNNAIYAFSGNGVTFSSDLSRRYMRIRLEMDIEDIQEVIYTRDLTEYIRSNNALLISAIYSCVKYWIENGMPDGNGRMISFNQWARKVTGIMELCDLGNPFQKRTKITASMQSGGDQKTPHIRKLVKYWVEKYGNKEINAESLRELASSNNLFPWMKLNEHSGKTLFSKMIIEHSGRIFAEYRIITDTDKKRTAYRLEHVPNKQVVCEVEHHNEICMSEEDLPIDTEALIASNPEASGCFPDIPDEELERLAKEYIEDSGS